jgi:hypothetical protein
VPLTACVAGNKIDFDFPFAFGLPLAADIVAHERETAAQKRYFSSHLSMNNIFTHLHSAVARWAGNNAKLHPIQFGIARSESQREPSPFPSLEIACGIREPRCGAVKRWLVKDHLAT